MSSLAAVLSRSGPLDRKLTRRMVAAAPHRGQARCSVELGRVALTVAGDDGSFSADLISDGRLAAAFTGFFDNLEAMARQVEKAGFRVEPRSPAAVLVAAFQVFGPDAAYHLRGAFTGVVTDGTTLWCFRDHLGSRSLFYRADPDAVYVATEVKQVVAGARVPRHPDLDVLERDFFGRIALDNRCAIRGVERVPGGTTLVADEERARLVRYWHPERLLETARPTPEELQCQFDELMTQAVSRTLVGGDVVSLSGGIDSPAIAAYAAPVHLERTGRPLAALSTVYPDYPTVDESRYIQAVADRFDLRLHTYRQRSRPTEGLRDWVTLFDGPVAVLSMNETAEHLHRAKALGFRNVLTGEVAEFAVDMRRGLLPHLVARGRIGAAFRVAAAGRREGKRLRGMTRQVVRAFLPRTVLSVYRRLRAHRGREADKSLPPWIDPGQVGRDRPTNGRREWREQQLVSFREPWLGLEADDIVQALAGVSIRRPWVDVDLWEFFLSLPAEVKFPDAESKTLVRRLLRGKVPDVVLDRTGHTVFDEFTMARIDYPALRSWLLDPEYRVTGVDYETLGDRLRREELSLAEFVWARDLAGVHAFLSSC